MMHSLFPVSMVLLLLAAELCGQQQRVILASFDGLGQEILDHDPVAKELRTLHAMRKRGMQAAWVQPAFPSTTANSHAAIWTGAYGNTNGIAGNANPRLPRAEHTFQERVVGFRSDGLLAEPIWITAARQGVSVVGHQVTQVYPFTEKSAGLSLQKRPTLLNSYQTRRVLDYQVLRARDVERLETSPWGEPRVEARGRKEHHFRWKAGELTFVATLVAGNAREPARMVIAERAQGPDVWVESKPTVTSYPRGRALAAHFSVPLPITGGGEPGDVGPLAMCFRLWEATEDGDFLLLATPLQELGISEGYRAPEKSLAEIMVREDGPLVGNGPSWAYLSGRLGKTAEKGGDGQAELRFLECMEFIARQYNRYSERLWRKWPYEWPQLLLDYFPYPDEMDHGWLGLSRMKGDRKQRALARRFQDYRRRGYQIVEHRMALLAQMARDSNAIFAVTSDHGMAAVQKNVNINAALREVGYLVLDENEHMDAKRSRAAGDYGILLNTEDWKGGIVPIAKKQAVLQDLSVKLGEIRDPETGERVFRAFYTEQQHGKAYGIGGPAGFDLYFDLAPGYAPERKHVGAVVDPLDAPRGRHGFLPTRADMRAIFVASGGGLRSEKMGPMRSTQIAPTLCVWLGIQPPAQAEGASAVATEQTAATR